MFSRIGMFEDLSKSLIKTKQPQATCFMFLFQQQTNTYGKKNEACALFIKAGQASFAKTFFHIQLQVQPPGSHLTLRLGGSHGNFLST